MSDLSSESAIEQEDGFTGELRSEYLCEFMSAVNALADEAKIEVGDDGISTAAVDPANVAMVEAKLDSSAFADHNEVSDTHGFTVRKIAPLVETASDCTAKLDFKSERKMLELGLGRYQYTHALITPEHLRQEPDILTLDLPFVADINIDVLREAVEWFDEFTTHVRVGYDVDSHEFWMEAIEKRGTSSGTDDGSFRLDRDELEYVREVGEAHSQFSIDYFKDIVKAVPEGYPVTIRLGEEFPMKLSYNIAWEAMGPNEGFAHGEVTFMQAPRIQSD